MERKDAQAACTNDKPMVLMAEATTPYPVMANRDALITDHPEEERAPRK